MIPLADVIAARVAGMRDHGAIMPQRQGHEGGRHVDAAGSGGSPRLVDVLIGLADQPRHELLEGFAVGRFLKTR